MFSLPRPSFRQLLTIAFLLVPALLAVVSVRGLYTLERLVLESRQGAERAARDLAELQRMDERRVTMERAARQYLVLDDPTLRANFEAAARESAESLARLADGALPATETKAWAEHLATIKAQIDAPRASSFGRDEALTADFRAFADTQARFAESVQRAAEARSKTLLTRLEEGREQLARQVLASIGLAVLLAFGFSMWLGRPLKRLESAIVALGENRMAEPVDIPGPADLRALGRRLDWLRLRLAELDADKARFLRHVSHELKTPLAALREGVALLEEGVAGALTESQREVARILRQNTMALQAQIEDLLRFNAAAFEARNVSRRRTDLVELAKVRVAEQRLQWQARSLQVTVSSVSDGPAWAEVDAEKIGVAFGNLLSNAIRFSPTGGTIRFDFSQRADGVRIDVSDSGEGVAPADRARVFEPFYRGERQPEGGLRGSGIGLSIVQEYVAAHGGRIELVDDAPGAHFRIELPHAHRD
ncbi:MAG: histidine kinase [Methylibium sp. NZG]|nr:MAG: histidine kinase [Methylibium sp. NZG]